MLFYKDQRIFLCTLYMDTLYNSNILQKKNVGVFFNYILYQERKLDGPFQGIHISILTETMATTDKFLVLHDEKKKIILILCGRIKISQAILKLNLQLLVRFQSVFI